MSGFQGYDVPFVEIGLIESCVSHTKLSYQAKLLSRRISTYTSAHPGDAFFLYLENSRRAFLLYIGRKYPPQKSGQIHPLFQQMFRIFRDSIDQNAYDFIFHSLLLTIILLHWTCSILSSVHKPELVSKKVLPS